MRKYKSIIFTFAGIVFALGLIWLLEAVNQDKAVSAETSLGIISSGDVSFDFGAVSMAKGKVSHVFKIKNSGFESLVVSKIYTSCMCTEAYLVKNGFKAGPFGMPGMDRVPSVSEELKPGEEAEIAVEFDPAAHGPAGLGRIERSVYIENSGKNPKFELLFSADVTP